MLFSVPSIDRELEVPFNHELPVLVRHGALNFHQLLYLIHQGFHITVIRFLDNGEVLDT